MVAWLRFLPMALKHLTNPIVFFVRRRVASSTFFKDKVFVPFTRNGNNLWLNIQQSVTRNPEKKREIAREQRKTLSEAEAINIGADFVAQVSAIAIGMLIIEFCDYLAKKNQQKRVDEIEVHIKETKEVVARLDAKDQEYENRIATLERKICELERQNTTDKTAKS